MIKHFAVLILGLAFLSFGKPGNPEKPARQEKEVYMFTSFREPATDGLYLLYSYDGYNWTDLGRSFLKPLLGANKLMRDPSMVRGADGTYHLVWTLSLIHI